MSNSQLRIAQLADQKLLESLQLRASLLNPSDREAILDNPDCIEVPQNHINTGNVLVLEVENAIVGFASVIPRADGNQELDALFVESEHWKSGYGRLLVEASSRLASSRGAPFLYVIGNPQALGFYEKCGFVFQGSVQTGFGEAPNMRRQLTSTPME